MRRQAERIYGCEVKPDFAAMALGGSWRLVRIQAFLPPALPIALMVVPAGQEVRAIIGDEVGGGGAQFIGARLLIRVGLQRNSKKRHG